MEINKIKVAVIGLGKMGGYHLKALETLQMGEFESYYKGDSMQILSNLEICGVCDLISDKTPSLKNIPFFDCYDELVKSAGPDIVIIATPTHTHFEIAKFALEQGIHVFVEKPIVTTQQEFDELLHIAAEKKLKIMAGHIERYNPVSLKLREILADFKNTTKTFSFSRTQLHDQRITEDIIVDKLIHDLDLSLFLFGPIRNYNIVDHQKWSGQVYELTLNTEHEYGTGRIFVSWLKNARTCRKIELKVDGQLIEGDFLEKTLSVDNRFVECDVPRWVEAQNNQVKDELVDFIVHCFSKSRNLPAPLLSLDEMSSTVRIIEDISNNLNP